jgi:two-component system OmpR family sensor kinase
VSLRARITVAVALVLLVGGLAATFVPLSARSSQQSQLRHQLTEFIAAEEKLASSANASTAASTSISSAYVARLAPGGDRKVLSTSALMPHSSPDIPSVMSIIPSNLSVQGVRSTSGSGSWEAAIVGTSGGSRLLVAVPAQYVSGLDRTAASVLLIARLLVLAVIVAAAWWILRLSLRPIAEVTRVAKAISSGDRSRRVPVPADGTEAANLARSFNSMIDQQQSSEDRLRQFLADASHELRTPVTAIAGFADLYRNGAVSDMGLEDVMRRIGQESARMRSLVEDMLLLARLDEGRPMDREPVDVTALATDAALDASAGHPSRRVSVEGASGLIVLGDDARLRQVLANLVTNSLKYTRGAVSITIMTKGSTVVIDVGDHGPGLESEAVGRAFDRFWRSAEARAQPGSGLGLSIVRGIVAAHDGNVEMQSSAEGTHVRVSLPVAPAQHGREDTASSAGPRTSEGGVASRQSDQDQPNSFSRASPIPK